MTRSGPRVRVISHDGVLRSRPSGTTDDTVVVDAGATFAEVLASLGIDRGLVGVAVADGRFVQMDAELQDDCVIHVYPLFGGG
jgi:sulfur carrier protein ThiS